ncbi:uncharacterized protein MICPUCDRAFT_61588 [Micromonas pusilla CCMP1545]|uniref:Predicted protein n=2 Tax=Micromonas pusilla TaxID=38833 RepID=C1MIB7_MICPC|nr:uncharacterized protein MICPUCDRAFT_61588 [Micromonas pusilla CCMP1545]EEH60352.1 predicted protein [Micromonas pusilla CCMP1545]|eukprot:XP_003055100.1 predicted protein [Micromonas pusilla CCMP1545]
MNFVTALFCPPPSSVPAPPTATLSPPPFPPTPGILGSFSPLPFFFSAGAATALLTRTPSSAAAASAAPDAAAAARGDAASSSAPIPIAARSRSSAIWNALSFAAAIRAAFFSSAAVIFFSPGEAPAPRFPFFDLPFFFDAATSSSSSSSSKSSRSSKAAASADADFFPFCSDFARSALILRISASFFSRASSSSGDASARSIPRSVAPPLVPRRPPRLATAADDVPAPPRAVSSLIVVPACATPAPANIVAAVTTAACPARPRRLQFIVDALPALPFAPADRIVARARRRSASSRRDASSTSASSASSSRGAVAAATTRPRARLRAPHADAPRRSGRTAAPISPAAAPPPRATRVGAVVDAIAEAPSIAPTRRARYATRAPTRARRSSPLASERASLASRVASRVGGDLTNPANRGFRSVGASIGDRRANPAARERARASTRDAPEGCQTRPARSRRTKCARAEIRFARACSRPSLCARSRRQRRATANCTF